MISCLYVGQACVKYKAHNAIGQCLGILLHVHKIVVIASGTKDFHGGEKSEEKASTAP